VNASRDEPLNFPLRCRPLLKPKIWGGRGLERVLGKSLPPDQVIGESWEVADVPEGTSSIAGGPLEGASLREVMERFGDRLLPGRRGEQFPLLVKFIDAQEDISIQVHPDADTCRRCFPAERSKNETWLIVHVEPGGAVLHGVRPGVTIDELSARIADGTVMEAMRRIDVRPGDVIHLPAGTLHAMLRGVMLLEVQEPSDSTFRVYDHDRLALDGHPRELHIEQALESVRLNGDAPACIEPRAQERPWGRRELLIDIAPYRMERLTLRGEVVLRREAGVPGVVVGVAGRTELQWPRGAALMAMGETFILPPGVERLALRPHEGESQVVVARPSPGRGAT